MVSFLRVQSASSLRAWDPRLKKKLNRSHIGIQGCLRRAREVVYWPNMNRELEDFISKCETCNTFQPAQPKEPLIFHEIPQRPWEKIGCDIFTFNNRDFLCTVDYFSDYFEIDELQKAKRILSSVPSAQNSTGHPMPLRSKQTGQGLAIIRPASSSAECQNNNAVTCSRRSLRPSSYLKDYVQT